METADNSETSMQHGVECTDIVTRNLSDELHFDQSSDSNVSKLTEDTSAIDTLFENDDLDLVMSSIEVDSNDKINQELNQSFVHIQTNCDERINGIMFVEGSVVRDGAVVTDETVVKDGVVVRNGAADCSQSVAVSDGIDRCQSLVVGAALDWSKGLALRDSTDRPIQVSLPFLFKLLLYI